MTTYTAIFQIICDVHSTNLRILFLLEAIKKEHLVAADNNIYCIKIYFYISVEVK